MKVYFVDIHGDISEHTIVNPQAEGLMMLPCDGCDMLIRSASGGISSAKRSSYHDTPQEALKAFMERQQQYIKQAEQRLLYENEAWDNACRQLASISRETTK